MKRRVAIYLRASTDHQSTEIQRNEINTFIHRSGWETVEVYEDFLSGSTGRRPALQQMLSDARAKKFSVIVTYRMDRFFRSLRELLTTLHELQEMQVDFVSLKDQLDFTTSAGRLMVHLLGAIAQFEREIIHSRVMAGIENARRKGIILGRPKMVPINDVLLLRQEGLSLAAIAKRIGFSKSCVHKVIQEYAGHKPSINRRIIDVEKCVSTRHKSIVFGTTQNLPIGKVQCHEQDEQCLERDCVVTSDTEVSK